MSQSNNLRGLSPKCRFPYDKDYDTSNFGLTCPEPSLAKQADAAAADINTIVKRWQNSGVLPTNINDGLAQFADVSDIPDYRGCIELVNQAQKLFSDLPSQVRDRFRNDPAEFLDFCSNPHNIPEMVSLGLANAPEPPTGGPVASPQTSDKARPVDGSTEAPKAS